MNPFISSAKQLINLHGVSCTYTTVTEGTYDVETGSVTNTEANTAIIAYPKQVKVNQYNYPNLIGKTVTEFLVLASDFVTKPNPRDKITLSGDVYSIEQVSEHYAMQEKVIYKILACRG
jgi:hypothetical protein